MIVSVTARSPGEQSDTATVARAASLRVALGTFVADLDPAELTPSQAAQLVGELAGMERLVQTGKVLAAGRAAEADAWRRQGHRSAGEWLARQTKSSVREADRLLETSKRLVDQPQLESAMRQGELNSDQATEVSEAAAVDPSAEARLVQTAGRESLAGLRDAAARTRAAARGDDAARHEAARRNRNLRTSIDGEGAHRIDGSNTAAAGAIIEAALKPFRKIAFDAARASGRREGLDAYKADALELMAAAALGITPTCLLSTFGQPDAPPPTPASGGTERETDTLFEPATAPSGAGFGRGTLFDHAPDAPAAQDAPAERSRWFDREPEPTGSAPPRARAPARPRDGPTTVIPWNPVGASIKLPGGRVKVISRIDHTALTRGHTVAGETCDIVGLGPVPVAAVRELMATGDPFLAAVVTRGQDVASVAHLGRSPTAYQRTALEWRDAHCVVEGCTASFCDIDHNTGWAITHDTRTGDIALVCPHDHRLKTSGWHLEPAPPGQRRRLLPPDHPDHPNQRSR